MTLTSLLEAIAQAFGGCQALRRCHAIEFSATMRSGSLAGYQQSIIDFRNRRFKNRYDYTVFHDIDCFDGQKLWEADRNGKVITLSDPRRAREIIVDQKLLGRDYLLNPDDYRIEVIDNGKEGELRLKVVAIEVESEPFAGATIGIDPESYRILYVDRVTIGERRVSRYDRYRAFDDVVLPTIIEEADPAGNVDRLEIETLTVNPVLDDSIFEPATDDPRDYQFLTGELRSVVPLFHELDHIYTEVVIAGQTYRFMVDTGASSTVLSMQIIEALGLESLGTVMANGVSGTQEVHFVLLPEIWIGNVLLTNQRVMGLDFTELNKRVPEMGGILGMDFFNRFVVGLDYVEGRMEIIDRSIFRYEGDGRELPIDFNSIEMSFDGYQGRFRIDTGGGSVSIHAPFVREHNLLHNRNHLPGTSMIAGVGGTELTLYAVLCHTLTIGEYTLADMPIRLTEISTGAFAQQRLVGNVGGDIWRKFRTWFDFTGERLFLEPNTNFNDAHPVSRLGLVLKAERGGYYVDSILTNSPAAELGVERDDELVDFDGQPATSIPFGELRERFRDAAGTRIPMTFRRRDGSIVECVVVLRDFLRHYDRDPVLPDIR